MANSTTMRTLLIVEHLPEAKLRGMSPATRRHRSSPEITFWWPGLTTDHLRGYRFDMVVETVWIRPDDRASIRAFCTQRDTLWVEGTLQ